MTIGECVHIYTVLDMYVIGPTERGKRERERKHTLTQTPMVCVVLASI